MPYEIVNYPDMPGTKKPIRRKLPEEVIYPFGRDAEAYITRPRRLGRGFHTSVMRSMEAIGPDTLRVTLTNGQREELHDGEEDSTNYLITFKEDGMKTEIAHRSTRRRK